MRPLELEESLDVRESLAGLLPVGLQRLEEVAPRVRPAADLDDLAGLVEVVVDGVGVGDQVALVAFQPLVHGGLVVLEGVVEEHVLLRRGDDPEVACVALVDILHQDAGGVGAQVGRGQGVLPHRLEQGPSSARPGPRASRRPWSGRARAPRGRRCARAGAAAGGLASGGRSCRRAARGRRGRARWAAPPRAPGRTSSRRAGRAPWPRTSACATRTTTREAGRRSTVSTTSSPMRSKASSPACWTSSGRISTSTRGSVSGRGLRPVGFGAGVRLHADAGGRGLALSASARRRRSLPAASPPATASAGRRRRTAPASAPRCLARASCRAPASRRTAPCTGRARSSSRHLARWRPSRGSHFRVVGTALGGVSGTAREITTHGSHQEPRLPNCFLARHSREQLSQRRLVDADGSRPHRLARGHPEQRSVQSLAQEAEAIAVPPEHLHPHRPLPHEDVQRSALRILAQPSVVTLNPAISGHFKTGQRRRAETGWKLL